MIGKGLPELTPVEIVGCEIGEAGSPQALDYGQFTFDREVMYWTGYIYRYWHYYSGENSKDIYKIADAKTMNECWLGFHTLDVEMAIDDLNEIHRQRIVAEKL